MTGDDQRDDAASIVARMAGLDTTKSAPIPPSRLIARFCPDVRNEGSVVVARGFCGYVGGKSYDGMIVGFDDGYVFMGALEAGGWRALHEKGDWPYVVYLRWAASDGERESIAEYCEADLTVWQFATHDEARAFHAGLKDAP